MKDLNLHITVYTGEVAPDGARASADTEIIRKLDVFFQVYLALN